MIGSTISHYKILEKLGEGGMGVVYKAQDTKLGRTVALKFLPEHISTSESDSARFMQEAQAAASLNHPNICTIHGIEEADGKHFIVMEFVDGQMLSEKTSLSMKQSLDIGIQVAEGLSAAHEKGIVHRDIKPENIMIRKDGIVQIMDFGLAKLRGASRLTKEGSTVGTAGYMSPEQVQGQETDHRSDIFSLGVLLYEMFTGQPPFKGVHETAITYEIVNVDSPPMSSIKPDIPPELDAIVLECLEKDPKERTQAAGQVAVDLRRFKRESSRSRMTRTMSTGVKTATPDRSGSVKENVGPQFPVRHLFWVVPSVVILFAVGLLLLRARDDADSQPVNRLNIFVIDSPGQLILPSDVPCMALSPDGRSLVYTLSESGSNRLYLRSLDTYGVRPLKGTENGNAPFFSPDGQWIGFVADGIIKKIPAAGGSAENICETQGFRGASWGSDGRIYYSPDFSSGLLSVSAAGGDVKPFSTLDSAGGERTHRWPQVLPDGEWVLFTVGNQESPNSYTEATLVMQSIKTGQRRQLNVRGETARYVEPGYLVVGRSASLHAAPFSIDDASTSTPLSMLVDGVSGDPGSGVLDFTISHDGDLVYLPGTLNRDLELVLVDRDGAVTPLPLPPQPFSAPRFSPDGTKLAVGLGSFGGLFDIWVYDLAKKTFNRLTFSKNGGIPLWSLDGKRIYHNPTVPEGVIAVQSADGSSPGTQVFRNPRPGFPLSLSPDENYLVTGGVGGADLRIKDLRNDDDSTPLTLSQAYSYGGHISPDGGYIVYGSSETGVAEIFVRTFPDLKGKWQISVGGGNWALWSPNGKEIFYLSTAGKFMAVPIRISPVFSPGSPRDLFDLSQMHFPNNPVNNYDVTPDGKRFVMIRNTQTAERISSFNYVQNWVRELEKLDE